VGILTRILRGRPGVTEVMRRHCHTGCFRVALDDVAQSSPGEPLVFGVGLATSVMADKQGRRTVSTGCQQYGSTICDMPAP
jgi:hypothetical protein